MSNPWADARKIIVKIGSSLLVDQPSGLLRRDWLVSLAEDIHELQQQGRQVVLVSSGAIALGRKTLGLPAGPLKLEHSQAAAAAGQVALTHAYQEIFGQFGRATAQILVTLGDTEERVRHINARNTISALLDLEALPIVNENDTVATQEIRYGDNDRLAARVVSMIEADCLVLLSDIDGLYTGHPEKDKGAKRLEYIKEITPEIEAMAGSVGSDYGSGGMITKLKAGRIAMQAGAHMVIASGVEPHPLHALSKEETPCTWFLSSATPGKARKRWIAGTLDPSGRIIVDVGAAKALLNGRSLLAAGIVRVEGDFVRGDTVSIIDESEKEIARGLVAYSAVNARRIIGRHSEEIARILGYPGRSNVVHRDDLVLMG